MNCRKQNKTTHAHPKKKRNQQKRKATVHGDIIMHAVKRREKMEIVVKSSKNTACVPHERSFSIQIGLKCSLLNFH